MCTLETTLRLTLSFPPHPVAHVTLSPVKIVVPENVGTVTLQVTRSGDISLRSRVFYNTRHTSTDDAAATSKNSMQDLTIQAAAVGIQTGTEWFVTASSCPDCVSSMTV